MVVSNGGANVVTQQPKRLSPPYIYGAYG